MSSDPFDEFFEIPGEKNKNVSEMDDFFEIPGEEAEVNAPGTPITIAEALRLHFGQYFELEGAAAKEFFEKLAKDHPWNQQGEDQFFEFPKNTDS